MGWVREGKDVGGLLGALQGVYGMSATAAVMPWLMPSLRSDFWRKYVWSHTETFRNMGSLFRVSGMRAPWTLKLKFIAIRYHARRARCEASSSWRGPILRWVGQYPQHARRITLTFGSLTPTKSNPMEVQFSREDIKAEVITFTAATLDGVAAFISPFVDNMVKHVEICDRLVAELIEADHAGRLSRPVVRYDETTELPFFMACIRETLRHDPPAQTILPRLVSEGGYRLPTDQGDVHVPANVQMGASPYIIHRNEAIFGADADKFRPERWLFGECGRCDSPLHHEAHVRIMEKYGMWWGYGDRECAGKYYAQMEMQKLCVELFRRFDVRNSTSHRPFKHARWAVGMFWNQMLVFDERKAC